MRLVLAEEPSAGPARPGIGPFLRRRRRQIDREAPSLGPYLRFPDRIGKPVTQEEMAEALEVSRQWYALLESDGAHASPALLDKISRALVLGPADRRELFELAIPVLTPPDASGAPRLLDAFSSREAAALELTIGTATEIETTVRRLDRLRAAFVVDGTLSREALRPRIASSWMRSRALHVDPARTVAPIFATTGGALRERLDENERLLRAARTVLRFLVDELAGSGYAVIVTDRRGCVLCVEGDPETCRRLARLDLQPGGDWSEDAAGTNAIGTALADGRPLQLMAAEHFCEGWHHLTCTAAPIRDPRTLEVLGALDITGSYKLIRGHLLALIMQCALEIEEELAGV